MRYWLVKTEPTTYSIDDFAREGVVAWDGVRNYQARNYLREMASGDLVLIYHSGVESPGVVGAGSVVAPAEPDESQFDSRSHYFDPKAKREAPRWFAPRLEFIERFPQPVSRAALLAEPVLEKLVVLRRGSRLSVTPVEEDEFRRIRALGGRTE